MKKYLALALLLTMFTASITEACCLSGRLSARRAARAAARGSCGESGYGYSSKESYSSYSSSSGYSSGYRSRVFFTGNRFGGGSCGAFGCGQ